MDDEARAAVALANYPRMPEDILRRLANDRQVSMMVNGVTNGIRDINTSTEFLHHTLRECSIHGQGRNEYVRANWNWWWKTTFIVEWSTKPNPPRRENYQNQETYQRAAREYLNTCPDLEPSRRHRNRTVEMVSMFTH